jgi:GNAT superfamily N-acetyltransferase
MYGFVRARELEGTFPGSQETGVYQTTEIRVGKGWGIPPESAWPYCVREWPPVEPPGMDAIAKKRRLFAYTRIRTLDDAKRVIAAGSPLSAAFEIDQSWSDPSEGRVAHPSKHVPNGSHTVMIYGWDDERQQLQFRNSWGESWGERGNGVLPYAYWTDRLIESWYHDFRRPSDPENLDAEPGLVIVKGGVNDVLGRPLHVVEITDKARDEVVGWTFVVETRETLEIEELFVRPMYRGNGHGTVLAADIAELRDRRRKRLVAWIPHVDPLSTGPKRVLAKLGLSSRPSPERWAARLAAGTS